MGYRRDPFAPDEWYHIYNRGIDKRPIFDDARDFERFIKLLYLANSKEREINMDLLKGVPYEEIFALPRGTPLVAIGAWCLMDNHPHLVFQEKEEGGIRKFMHKIGTAYTSYYNRRHNRIGNLMMLPFRSKHIDREGYLHRVVQYVHLNPAELFEPGWKEGRVSSLSQLEEKLLKYACSSLLDYWGNAERPERAIIDQGAFELLAEHLPPLSSVLSDAAAYYDEVVHSFDPKPRGRPIKA